MKNNLIILFFVFTINSYFSQVTVQVSDLNSITGEAEGDNFGAHIEIIDLDGDGFSDFMIGAQYNDDNGIDAGKVYVYFGNKDLVFIPELEILGEFAGDLFGEQKNIGDVNADVYEDIGIGSSRNSSNGISSGRSYVYFGGPLLDDQPDIIITGNAGDRLHKIKGVGDINGDGIDDFIAATGFTDNYGYVNIYFGSQSIDNTPDLILSGEGYWGDRYGTTIAAAGDVNGDGYNDILVGDYLYNFEEQNSGIAYLYFGGSEMDNKPDKIFNGSGESNGNFGWPLADGGDINGDGFDDVIIGARNEDAGGDNSGRVYVFFGGEYIDNVADVKFNGKETGQSFGYPRTILGKLNDDAVDDILIPGIRSGNGKAYIYFGKSNLIDTPSIIFEGENIDDGFGVCSAFGDINNDGIIDLIFGAHHNDDNGSEAGKVYFYTSTLTHIDSNSIEHLKFQIPETYSLSQNYPNPFNPTTMIKFGLPKENIVVIEIYDLVGRKVSELVNKQLKAGYHEIEFDGSKLAGGIYFYKLQVGDFVQINKMVLLK